MVDEERVIRLAGEITRDVARLRGLSHAGELTQLPDQLDAVKYRFITAIEGCTSIAHHILASEGWAAPETNAAAMRGLAEHAVISNELGVGHGEGRRIPKPARPSIR
ncbi:DUF86 domain-containing protein [Phytoactinopolyspora halotolerans]|uniref:DUF86 domain-containing protein n=1 Tax=Phytoactinopolyspora halotolerans TaxID=1981512 RepID=A0A6L9S714_9ACTN|nr:HepT-like ribonuclease domain-containing protein [Phytoactinopolyspora halotolerans]NED99769.1 DUF86 domain-containing protein [Phytoactinopolyspora halotolerans]